MRWAMLAGISVAAMTLPLLSAPAPKGVEPRLGLRLKTSNPKPKKGARLLWEVSLVNRGKQSVTLVQPGDGSECGWRTPIIEWVIDGKAEGKKAVAEKAVAEVEKKSDVKEPKAELKPACLGEGFVIGRRCGNINPLKLDEVFDLAPAKEVKLNEWVGEPSLTPGKYKVAVRYFNLPDVKWKGLSNHDAKAMKRATESFRVALESNTVEVEIPELAR